MFDYHTAMLRPVIASLLAIVLLAGGSGLAAQQSYRTLNDKFPPPPEMTIEEWTVRAAHLKERILATAGLLPAPEKTPLNPVIFGEVQRADYTVSKVYFESLPGFYVTGNLYKPAGSGPFPAILSPHGHWAYGRLENSEHASVPGRAINLARQGFVVFTYDMIGYNDSRQLPHTFGGLREHLWGLSLAGLQLWNSIRALDFLESLRYVRRNAIGATGASGGGTQTFLLAAVDERVAAAAPVNMISLQMQGGCLCENQPGLRLDTTNVEIAATIAPRPLLMVSATGDWTANTLELEYPAVRKIYALAGAEDRVHGERFDAPHNYNKQSREAMYTWMARWLGGAAAGTKVSERGFTPEPLADALVFHRRAMPEGALTPAALTDVWIASAKRQLSSTDPAIHRRALLHALGYSATDVAAATAPDSKAARSVVFAGSDPELERLLDNNGFSVHRVAFTAFDTAAAKKVNHFDTYNRTAASARVADIVAAVRARPGAALVAVAGAGPEGLLASAIAPARVAIVDAEAFKASDDAEFLERLFIPGLRRAGDLQTAAEMAGARLVVHNAGDLSLRAGRTERTRLGAREILEALRAPR